MLNVKDVSKGVGPKQKAALQELAKVSEAAKQRVADLEALRAQRLAEQSAAQPAAVVTAGTDPRALAQGVALAGAVASVIAQIDQDLSEARQQATKAGRVLNEAINVISKRRHRIEELDDKIAALVIERDGLAAELAA